jgi:Zn-dependent protease
VLSRPGSPAAAFHLAGFPVQVRPGFVVFLLLVIAAQGPEFGLPFALFVAAFTLVHELGHAVAARRTGARASISLDFMAGYAAFTPTRRLTRGERVGIALAGPIAQILSGAVAYVAISIATGVGSIGSPDWDNPLVVSSLWAGPVLGVLNLAPVLPFDGGHVALALLEAASPRHARRIMQVATVVLSFGAILWLGSNPDNLPYLLFAAIPLFTVVAQVADERGKVRAGRVRDRLEAAEAAAWSTGRIDFPRGCLPSPWFRAWQQLTQGHPDVAVRILVDDYVAGHTEPDPSRAGSPRPDALGQAPARWWPPDAAPADALGAVVALLPDPLPPAGRPVAAHAMAEAMLRSGHAHRAGLVAADAYGRFRAPLLALDVARAAAIADDGPTCRAWLAAARRDLAPSQFVALVTRHGELAPHVVGIDQPRGT